MTYVGQLQAAGLAKESILGTLVTPPTEFIPFIPADSFYPSITLLKSTSIRNLPDRVYKAELGPGEVKGLKAKWEAEGENVGNLLMGTFGTDSVAEAASFVVTTSNQKIDFTEDGGSELHASLTPGTYVMGASSAVSGSLCALIKSAMQAVGTGTYTVTFNAGTRKVTIAVTGAVSNIIIKWLTGANNANGAYALLGFTKANTSSASSATSDSTTAIAVYNHTFTRLANAQLPTYSWWFSKGAKYLQFLGSMVNKLDITAKAKEFVIIDADYTALTYDDNGTSQTPSYSPVRPWTFSMMTVNVDGSPVQNYDNLKISFDNMVKADHVLNQSIYPGKIYSEGWEISVSMDLFVENATQYAKFLAGTSCALNFVLASTDNITNATSGSKYTLTLDMPVVYYEAAPYPDAPGVIKISFTGKPIYDTNTTKTISAVLKNSVSTAY